MTTIGFVINPIAGMGGAVGLKGTDGPRALKEALRRGAKPVSPVRARVFVSELCRLKEKLKLLTWAGPMGESVISEYRFTFEVFGTAKRRTTREDTQKAVEEFVRHGAELIVFVGGDGTAKDVAEVVGDEVPTLGVPAGVKMFSGVFAATPRDAALIVEEFVEGRARLEVAEVLDVDEEAFRRGRLDVRAVATLLIPRVGDLVQCSKSPSALTGVEGIVEEVLSRLRDDAAYIFGPGSTVKAIMRRLGYYTNLLGVDVTFGKTLVGEDVSETEILKMIEGKRAYIIVSPTGGQGYVFGRGNQQISPRVIRAVGKGNIIIVSTREKLANLRCLRVDTIDEEVNEELRGYWRVIVGRGEERLIKVV